MLSVNLRCLRNRIWHIVSEHVILLVQKCSVSTETDYVLLFLRFGIWFPRIFTETIRFVLTCESTVASASTSVWTSSPPLLFLWFAVCLPQGILLLGIFDVEAFRPHQCCSPLPLNTSAQRRTVLAGRRLFLLSQLCVGLANQHRRGQYPSSSIYLPKI